MQKEITCYVGKFLSILCVYWRGFSTKYVLSLLIEKWESCLFKLGFTEALMDISKEFDTMNHELLITKLYAYGFSNKALGVLSS